MTEQMYEVRFGNTTIHYTLSYAPRKTLAITVAPDLSVSVSAPENTALAVIEARVLKRAPWILRQQRELETYLPKQPPRQYVSGETHRYLGRQYRLKIIEDSQDVVKLSRGYLTVHTTKPADRGHVRQLLESWYLSQAQRILPERLGAMLPRFHHLSITEPNLVIKFLEANWGSCTDSGTITLNVRLVQVPKHFIDYVIIHELCHLIEHNHSSRFYRLLDQMMPDWRERRRELNAIELY